MVNSQEFIQIFISPFSYLYTLMGPISGDGGLALCKFVLPVFYCSTDSNVTGLSYSTKSNESSCINLPSKSISITMLALDNEIHILFENGQVGVYSTEIKRKWMSPGLTKCPSLVEHLPVKNHRLNPLPDGYLIVSDKGNETVQLSGPRSAEADTESWQCNELFHLGGTNSLSITRQQFPAPGNYSLSN